MFTENDLKQITEKGLTKAKVEQQIQNFITGFPYANVVKAATPDNGIIVLNEEKTNEIIEFYKQESKNITITKFVPASGAASRMFKALFEFFNAQSPNIDNYPEVKVFFENIQQFAFYGELDYILNLLNVELKPENYQKIIGLVLNDGGLNYGFLPKALIKFHKYETGVFTSLDEHLVEAAKYAKNDSNNSNLVFTVSAEHKQLFNERIDRLKSLFENEFNVNYNIELTEQKSSTDIIAVDNNNKPFRNSDGSLLFRPGGHGALIENLNDIDSDIIFVKNIDNVVHQKYIGETIKYKQVIAGYLLTIKKQTEIFLSNINNAEYNLEEIENFVKSELFIEFAEAYADFNTEQKLEYLTQKLNRPIRVCGMVKNEGEPGGGPFWVKEPDGTSQLQIVESAEISDKDMDIVKNATHFNPVDLVCSTKDFEGNKFNLLEFVNANAGFISEKSKDGKFLKAQELPGLWNGAMANWTTLFVEVPIITFNPVKTVNDLLRKEHQ